MKNLMKKTYKKIKLLPYMVRIKILAIYRETIDPGYLSLIARGLCESDMIPGAPGAFSFHPGGER